MKKYTHIIEDGIYKISLNSIFEYIVQDSDKYNPPKNHYRWLRYVSEQVCASDENENTSEIENFNDWMFGIKTDGSKSALIQDFYFAVPAMTYILFTWLQYSKNIQLYEETKRIWELLHAITYDSSIFYLPTNEPAFKL